MVVGDALIDVIQDDGSTCGPGGAGLNLAVGVRRLGTSAALACPISADDLGSSLRIAIAAAAVTLIPLACTGPTGVATSRRVAGEPTYEFSQEVHQRLYTYTPEDIATMRVSNLLAVNSFPMHDMAQIEELLDVLAGAKQIFVVDPNVRPGLMVDRQAYRNGLLRLASAAHVVKLSGQDLLELGFTDHLALVDELLRSGPRAVILTQAERGAVVYTVDGLVLGRPVPERPEPIVDTMGAGDAALACLSVEFAAAGVELDEHQWGAALDRAMALAADICRVRGGNLASIRTTDGADHDRPA